MVNPCNTVDKKTRLVLDHFQTRRFFHFLNSRNKSLELHSELSGFLKNK
jgi:hypothetical protein